MGSAKDKLTCTSIIFDQETSVGEVALFVATLGSSEALSGVSSASKLAKLKAEF